MKVAILTPTLYRTQGLDRVAKQQASALAQQGHKVTIFAFRGNMEPPEDVALGYLGMPKGFLAERIFRLTFLLNVAKAIKWVPRLKQFDVVCSHQYPMNWLAYLARRFYGSRYIYYNHHHNPPEAFSGLVERAYTKMKLFLEKWTIKRADGAISVSHYSAAQLKNWTGLSSKVVYNTIDTQRFHKELDSSKIRARYNLGNSPMALYVGAIWPHKAVHLLIEALRLVKHNIPDVRLVVVGKHVFSAYSNAIRGMSDDSVILVGETPDAELPCYYAACDIYTTASLWEGFNLPLVEAQACGKPVVAFNIGPHPEVVKDGETGFLVPPGNVNALAEAIIKLLKDDRLRHEMGENAYRMVREKFSWNDITQKTLEVYEETIKAWERNSNKRNTR